MPGLTTVVVDEAALIKLGTSPDGVIHMYWVRLLARIDAVAKQKLSGEMVNVRTGNLRSSQEIPFVTVIGNKIVGTAQNKASYAAAVHNGSKPHEIRPSRKSILTGWSYGGSPVFTPLVHHPGTRARPWLTEAAREVLANPASVSVI